MKVKIIAVVLLLPSLCFSKPQGKTVSECTKDVERQVFAIGQKKAQKVCEEHSQQTVDCAVENFRQKGLGRTFDDAVKECARNENR